MLIVALTRARVNGMISGISNRLNGAGGTGGMLTIPRDKTVNGDYFKTIGLTVGKACSFS